MRRIALIALVLLSLIAAGCGDDDDDVTVADDDTSEDVTDGPTADDGEAALAFFQSTEERCAAHAEETGNSAVDPSYFAEASYDQPMSEELGAIVIIDGAGNQLIVNVDDEQISGTDGAAGPLPQEYTFGCPEDLYVGTINDGGVSAGTEACAPWTEWGKSGDAAALDELEALLNSDPAAGGILDSIDFLQSDPPTDTPEEQEVYEANVDTIEADLQAIYGCAPSRGTDPRTSG